MSFAKREFQGLSLNADRPTLPEELCAASAALERPLVIFFDQFEEFFIRFSGAAGADRVAAFVGDIAALYRDRNSGVHVVFSMREEYFVEMDTFRSEIPSIFHNDSNLDFGRFLLLSRRSRRSFGRPPTWSGD